MRKLTVIINIVGVGRQSGKTSLIEAITRRLCPILSVWTVKHISTSFDTANSDTWRHLRAGAKAVIAITTGEIITIKKSPSISLEKVLREIPSNVDLLLVEGFKKSDYPKIAVAQKREDALNIVNIASKVFAVYGGEAAADAWKNVEGVTTLRLERIISEIKKMILKDIVNRLPGLNCQSCGFPTCDILAQAILEGEAKMDQCQPLLQKNVILTVDGKDVYLSSFPRKFVRETVLGMISSLKDINITKNSHINLEIKI